MIEVRRLGHATLTAPDIEAQIGYYTEVVGLTLVERAKKRAIFASKQGLEAVALELGPPNPLARLAFQAGPGRDLAQVARAVGKYRGKSERPRGISPMGREDNVVRGPSENASEVLRAHA